MEAYTQEVRQKCIDLYQQGQTQKSISEELRISYKTIRTWVKRYCQAGPSGLLPSYSHCGRSRRYGSDLIARAVSYKSAHPSWGAGFILLKLEDDFPGVSLPSQRQLQNYFRQADVQPLKTKQPKGSTDWAQSPFDRVQADAKECLSTADGQVCCYLNFTDEYSGSVLDAFVFPL